MPEQRQSWHQDLREGGGASSAPSPSPSQLAFPLGLVFRGKDQTCEQAAAASLPLLPRNKLVTEPSQVSCAYAASVLTSFRFS